jgi:peptidoglycan/xylan/chitin deacetylase (PgdA/CDA1 family)
MPQISILCYHGIIDKSTYGFNSSGKHLNENEFDNQMGFLARNFEIVSMQNIENYFLGLESLPKKSVAITFDDGYANNLWTAHPILEKYGLSATIYLATEYINSRKIMWTDRLELALIQSQVTEFEVLLDKIQHFDISNLTNKLNAFKTIKSYIKRANPKLNNIILDDIDQKLEIDKNVIIPSIHKFLDWDEVRFMNSSGVWDIGAHTEKHYSLGTLNRHDGIKQINDSILKVKTELRSNVLPLFSYPEGRDFDMPKYAIKFLRSIGLKSAPSANPGENYITKFSKYKAMKLKRYLVGFENFDFPWEML